MRRSHRAVEIDINLAALTHNFAIVRRCAPRSRVFAVVKSDAYGHGAVAVAQALSGSADAFAVVAVDEALILREAGIETPILVLQGARTAAEMRAVVAHALWPVIHTESQLAWLDQNASAGDPPLQVWLKLDSGMGRLGFTPAELLRHWRTLYTHPRARCAGVLSHFASADNPSDPFNATQLNCFDAALATLNTDAQPPVQSMANSAAVLALPASHLDWVRPGIMLYGPNPLLPSQPVAEASFAKRDLRPVMRVTAPIISIKQRRRGDSIGYAQTWQCPEDMPIALVACGYGDGLPRVLKNASVRVDTDTGAHLLPVIGRVSMDSIALDLRPARRVLAPGSPAGPANDGNSNSDPVAVQVGDRVELWGDKHPIETMAAAAATIPYELLCGIRGERRYRNG